MDIPRLQHILSQDESRTLEFKRELDLSTRAGKAKFLKEMLALANSLPAGQRAHLIIGVEDKTKRLIGLQDGITEERVQQIVAKRCRPPIGFRFEVQEYQGVTLGVATIYAARPPHTLKSDLRTERDGKEIELSDNAVFVRRGSTIDEAQPDEIIRMAQARQAGIEDIPARLDNLTYWLEEIAGAVNRLESTSDHLHEAPNRYLESAAVGMLSMGIAIALQASGPLMPIALFAANLSVLVLLSLLGFAHFSMWRSFFMAMFMTPLMAAALSAIQNYFLAPLAYQVSFSVLAGCAVGILASGILQRLEASMR